MNSQWNTNNAQSDINFDVMRVISGMQDENVANLAQREQRILVTFDSDFANILTYPPQNFFGIVRISIDSVFANTVKKALDYLFSEMKEQQEYKGKLIILEPTTFRIWENNDGIN